MITAKQILEFYTKTYGNKSLEVLVNPSTWREAAKEFRSDLRELNLLKKVPPVLRYGYNPDTEEIGVWIAFLATHEDVYGYSRVTRLSVGYFDPTIRKGSVLTDNGVITDMDRLPKRLQEFLSGLELVGVLGY